ncbi:protein-L-isoaspartate(D-aspartate) O-methyltransferase-like [Ornithodoros turicata]|uniref:protein-L-isoaspartate(D-aspartate) O-methyltransferase-like n=1 Tax=Ornithodoros turicata TaxID=34597 RepID=UPI0031398E9A
MLHQAFVASVLAISLACPAMAWLSFHGRSNNELVNYLKRIDIIVSDKVETVMKSVDRRNYANHNPYDDSAQDIGYAATISAPHTHARALESLKDHLRDRARALDVGSGSGYITACMALMVGNDGLVVGIDHIPELVNTSIANIKKDQPGLIESKRIKLIVGDGRQGFAPDSPYDAIHVGAVAPELPMKLLQQLKNGGRMVCPIGHGGLSQKLEQIDKLPDGTVKRTELADVAFVPLTDRESQRLSSRLLSCCTKSSTLRSGPCRLRSSTPERQQACINACMW